MVAAELSPYARAGETADSVAALSRMLVQLGHEVTVALPRYSSFEDQGLLVARRLGNVVSVDELAVHSRVELSGS